MGCEYHGPTLHWEKPGLGAVRNLPKVTQLTNLARVAAGSAGPWPVLILLCVLFGGFMPPDGPAHFILHPVSSPLGAQKVSLLGGNSLRDTGD